MSQPRVVRQSTVIVLKLIAAALGGDLFARVGVPLPPIVDALPTELPQLDVRTQHTDQLFRLADDSILHLEFQTTHRPGELIRFAASIWSSASSTSSPCGPSWWSKSTATPCRSACRRRQHVANPSVLAFTNAGGGVLRCSRSAIRACHW